ncbi:hypothetical protein Tco_0160973, partial [Tanacetum coccineum]
YDYGPIPFRFYRYWLEVDGFDKLVRDSWNVAPVNKKNAIRNFMGKLHGLVMRLLIREIARMRWSINVRRFSTRFIR